MKASASASMLHNDNDYLNTFAQSQDTLEERLVLWQN
jgi:hypothetical protein